MNLSNEAEIRSKKYLGGGTFGSVYQSGDYAIKLYHDIVKTEIGEYVKNPCLKRKRKLNLLLQKNLKIKRSNLISDLLFINGELKGVCYPFHDSSTLSSVISSTTFEEKQNISHQLINNTKELNRHFIYPCDSKLNNILYDGKNINIIDLDDVLTKVTYGFNPIYKKQCLESLKKTIISIFSGDQYLFNSNILTLLESYQKQNNFFDHSYCSSGTLNSFIIMRSEEVNLLFINPKYLEQTDIKKLKKIVLFTGIKPVLIFEHNKDIDYYIRTIQFFKELGIDIYDIILQNNDDLKGQKIMDCINNYNISNYYIFDKTYIYEQFKRHQSLQNNELNFCINEINSKKLTKK